MLCFVLVCCLMSLSSSMMMCMNFYEEKMPEYPPITWESKWKDTKLTIMHGARYDSLKWFKLLLESAVCTSHDVLMNTSKLATPTVQIFSTTPTDWAKSHALLTFKSKKHIYPNIHNRVESLLISPDILLQHTCCPTPPPPDFPASAFRAPSLVPFERGLAVWGGLAKKRSTLMKSKKGSSTRSTKFGRRTHPSSTVRMQFYRC